VTRILAIDDDEGVLFTLNAVAKLAGWELDGHKDPSEGVKAFQKGGFDLVLVDYHMPAMDGILVVKALRRFSAHVPIVVLTVDDRFELADRFRQAGADDFALKPIKALDLISRLRVHLRAHPSRPDLPKGISEQTLDSIVEFVRQAGGPVSAEDVAERLGVAYQTANRYLEYLESTGRVRVQLEYLHRGRPRKLYALD